MFRGIGSTIAIGTFFGSWPVVIGWVVVSASFFWWKARYPGGARYLGGSILAIFSLIFLQFFSSPSFPQTLPSDIEVCVSDQRSADTWVAQYHRHEVLLRSDTPLLVGSCVRVYVVWQYAVPYTLSRGSFRLPSFISAPEKQFADRLTMKGYTAWGFVKNKHVFVLPASYPLSTIQRVRENFKAYIYQLFGYTKTAALLLGLTTGDRSGFSREEYTSFVESGLSHLVAVSGSNIVYVTTFLTAVLFRLPFYIRILVVSVGILVYGILCGADSSVVRAVGMCFCGLLATGVGRPVHRWFALQVVAGAMLLRNPLLLRYDLGFILSFCAVGGIMWWTGSKQEYTPRPKNKLFTHIWTGRLLPTCGATRGVLAPLLFWIGKFSVASIGINMIIVPFVPLFLLTGVGYMLGGPDLLLVAAKYYSNALFWLAARGQNHGGVVVLDSMGMRFVFVITYIFASYRLFALISSKRKTSIA